MTISNFKEIRRDGGVISEMMTLNDIIQKGWAPDKIIRLEWCDGVNTVQINEPNGMLAKVVDGRRYLAIIKLMDDSDENCVLSIVNDDGTSHQTRMVLT